MPTYVNTSEGLRYCIPHNKEQVRKIIYNIKSYTTSKNLTLLSITTVANKEDTAFVKATLYTYHTVLSETSYK